MPVAASKTIRSVLAVVAGIAVLTVLSFSIEAVVNPALLYLFAGALPDAAALAANLPARLLMMTYSLACVAAGGYVTAWIARRAPVRHAVAMGVLQALMTIDVWLSGFASAPAWQWMLSIALLVPAAWWGASIRTVGPR
ncbi:MAG: hypothetical protein ABI811_22795 [Acidobacteriota bacterium]